MRQVEEERSNEDTAITGGTFSEGEPLDGPTGGTEPVVAHGDSGETNAGGVTFATAGLEGVDEPDEHDVIDEPDAIDATDVLDAIDVFEEEGGT